MQDDHAGTPGFGNEPPPAQGGSLESFHVPTHVFFGPGAVARTGEIVHRLGIDRALVVTDDGVMRAGIGGHVLNALAGAGVSSVVFQDVEPQPAIETAQKAAALYRARSCSGIVAVGGGSAIDAAKAAGLLASNPGELRGYFGVGKVGEPLPPLVAVPTTVGAGSEVTNLAIITDRARRRRALIGSHLLAPDFALLDPGLVLTLPPSLLASSALDTLARAVESVMSLLSSPFTDGLALEAIRIVAENLAAAVASPALAPRASLLYASTQTGMAFSYTRLGLVQSMAHALSAHHGIADRLSTTILLPYVMEFNAEAAGGPLGRVAAALGVVPAAGRAIEAVRRLASEAGVPQALGPLGVDEASIPQMAEDVLASGSAQIVNPRALTRDDLIDLYQRAQ